jgi:lactate dehydrogenase-like 2-hydroxyacid dehydrogenase
MIEAADRLKVISTISVGVDHIDLLAASRAAIPVGHTPGVLVDSTADLTLALMLAVTRRVAEADRWIRSGHWTDGWQSDLLLGTDISQATIGIVGLGPIGEAVVSRLKGFGCRILTWNRTPKQVPGAESVALDALFSQSDMVSLHTALTQETTHIASRARLASMPSGSSLINTGRGLLVDEVALIDEVQSGRLKAGLDVLSMSRYPLITLLKGWITWCCCLMWAVPQRLHVTQWWHAHSTICTQAWQACVFLFVPTQKCMKSRVNGFLHRAVVETPLLGRALVYGAPSPSQVDFYFLPPD